MFGQRYPSFFGGLLCRRRFIPQPSIRTWILAGILKQSKRPFGMVPDSEILVSQQAVFLRAVGPLVVVHCNNSNQ
jgi:hypothetical protein